MNAIEIPAQPSIERSGAEGSPDIPPMAAAVAIGIAFAISLGGLAFAEFGWVPGIIGLPVVAGLAWRMSPELIAADGSRVLAVTLWFAARTILCAAGLVVTAMSAAILVSGLGWVVDDHPAIQIPLYLCMGFAILAAIAIIYLLFGLAFVGLPMLALVVPAAIVWAILVRAIAGRMARGAAAPGRGSTGLGAVPR